MTVLEHNWNLENVAGKEVAPTEAYYLELMPSGPQPVLAQESLVRELLTTIFNVVYHALSQGLEVRGNLSMSEICRNDEFDLLKKEMGCWLEEVNSFKMEKWNIENALLEKVVAMKVMTRSVVDLARIVILRETERDVFVKTNE